jgi:hypothetical protein
MWRAVVSPKFTPGEEVPYTPRIGGWMDIREGMDIWRK